MGKTDSDDNKPTPVPGPTGMNDFIVDSASRSSSPSSISGVMVYTPPNPTASQSEQSEEVKDGQRLGVDFKSVV